MKHLLFICFSFCVLFVACERNEYAPSPISAEFSVADAKKDFETNAQDLRYVNSLFGSTSVKSNMSDIVPNWNHVQVHQRENLTTIMVPIMERGVYWAVLTESIGEYVRAKNEDMQVESYLVIQKESTHSTPYRFVSTVIGVSNKFKDNPFMYTGDRSAFEGFMLLSTEQGDVFKVLYYHNGQVFRLKKHKHSHEASDLLKSYRIGISISTRMTSTKGGGGYSTGDVWDSYCFVCHEFSSFANGYCSYCGAPAEEIGNDSWEYFCQQCGLPLTECSCSTNPYACPVCGEDPCVCYGYCPFCGLPGCSGECLNNNGGGGGSNGGNGGGNNQSGQNQNNAIGQEYEYSEGDVVAVNPLNNMESTQVMNLCFFTVLQYTSFLLNREINAGEFLRVYCQISNVLISTVLNEGVPNSQQDLLNIVDVYFQTTPYSSFVNAVNNSCLTICTVDMGENIRHCILVVGYTGGDNSNLIFLDPIDGLVKYAPESIIPVDSIKFVISGLK